MPAYQEPGNFSKDHWSTLAYAETIMVECAGFEVGFDPRMRQNRRNFRTMWEQCARPKRVGLRGTGKPMDPKYSTKMRNGYVDSGHDDWSCIQDMAQAGYFSTATDDPCLAYHVEPGVLLHLSPLGRKVADELRAHKRRGGTFSNFYAEMVK